MTRWMGLVVALLCWSEGVAMAADEDVSGRTAERELEGDAPLAVADDVLWLPRALFGNLLRANAIAMRFAFDSRLVPTGEDTSEEPRIFVFPTVFAETSRAASVGARMITRGGPFATSHRVGFGGVDELVAENGVGVVQRFGDVLLNATVEGLVEQKSDLEHHGVGPSPREDARNRFLGERDEALYDEKRTRALAAVALRPWPVLETAFSFSAARRQVSDTDDGGPDTLSSVLDLDRVTLSGDDTWLGYGELALRMDTRSMSGPPRPGFVGETYFGYAHDLKGRPIRFLRAGGRVQGFIPIVRRTNLLALRFIFDGVRAVSDTPIPFTELAGQPAFRGEDRDRDVTSYVASVDYIWQFASIMSTRLFVDFTTVAPAVDEVDFGAIRWAVGTALEIHSRSTDIARFGIAGSPDGVHVRLNIGSIDAWGDRQRRD